MFDPAENPLHPEDAFVLQLAPSQGELAGRVEHVVTGAATTFLSTQELVAFLRTVLHERAERCPDFPSNQT